MRKEKFLITTVIVLLLLNFGTLGYLFFFRPGPPPGKGMVKLDQEIIKTLQLDNEQQKKFDVMKNAHHEQVLQSERSYHEALVKYFSLLSNEVVPQSQYDSLLTVALNIQKSRAEFTYRHFEELKNLCSPEQRKNFDQLLPILTQVLVPRRYDRPRRGNGI